MRNCPNCKVELIKEAVAFCTSCGFQLVSTTDLPTLYYPTEKRSSNVLKFQPRCEAKGVNTINFDNSSNSGIVANNLTVKTTKRSVKLTPPPGIIAADANMRGYAKYLIDKYHDYRKSDEKLGKMKFVPIYAAIKREFKCNWDYVPVEQFNKLVSFLQYKIDKTVTGQSLRKRDQRRYRIYAEWLEKRKN